MHGNDGVDYPNEILYEEIVKPSLIDYSHDSRNKDEPGQFHVIIRFEE